MNDWVSYLITAIASAGSLGGAFAFIFHRQYTKETGRGKKIENEILILQEVEKDNSRLREHVNSQDAEIKKLNLENAELRRQLAVVNEHLINIYRLLPADAAAKVERNGQRPSTSANDKS